MASSHAVNLRNNISHQFHFCTIKVRTCHVLTASIDAASPSMSNGNHRRSSHQQRMIIIAASPIH